ncbi:hypothetical protein RA983_21305, partial [Mycobacteroides abscessus subsp. abscessus]
MSGTAFGQKFVDVDGFPFPRIFVRELAELVDQTASSLDCVGRQSARQHLRSPSVQHRFEYTLLGAKKRNAGLYTKQTGCGTGQFVKH